MLFRSPAKVGNYDAGIQEGATSGTYPEALKTLAKVVEGTPEVHTYEVSNSTFHKIAAHATA